MSDWRQYYSKVKSREKYKKYYWSHLDKMKEIGKKYREKNHEKYLESCRKGYSKWISNPENLAKKKAYQKEWYQRVKKQSEREQRQEIYKVRDLLREKKPYIVGEYSAEMRVDTGGMFFFFIKQNGNVIFISDKYENENKAVKELMEAVL